MQLPTFHTLLAKAAVYPDLSATARRAAYDKVVTKYAMAPHVEDAKDRLIALGRPVPEPTKEQLAESQAEEESRVPVKLTQRAVLLFSGRLRRLPRHVGDPTMKDPPPTYVTQVDWADAGFLDNTTADGQTPRAWPRPVGRY